MIAADGARLADSMMAMERAGADLWHWDIMDGHFVPNLTFGPATVKACRAVSALEFDVHLMVSEPAKWIAPFADAGANIFNVHLEADTDIFSLVAQIKKCGCRAGLVLNPETSLDDVPSNLWAQIDRLFVMSVNPGFGGQGFIDVSEKIRAARKKFPMMDIAVDGGINPKTAPIVRLAGATTLISGSDLFGVGEAHYKERIAELRGGAA